MILNLLSMSFWLFFYYQYQFCKCLSVVVSTVKVFWYCNKKYWMHYIIENSQQYSLYVIELITLLQTFILVTSLACCSNLLKYILYSCSSILKTIQMTNRRWVTRLNWVKFNSTVINGWDVATLPLLRFISATLA